MLVVVDGETDVSRMGVCSPKGMCPDLIEGCDELVEWRFGVVLCEPFCFSIHGVKSARQVLFLAVVDYAEYQQHSRPRWEGLGLMGMPSARML
jgi:hypothetical protein